MDRFNSYEITFMLLVKKPHLDYLREGLSNDWISKIPKERREYLKNYIKTNYNQKWFKDHI